MTQTLALVLISLFAGALVVAVAALLLRKKSRAAPVQSVSSRTIAEKVRSVGKLVGVEVHAKEITTSTKGWSWIPSLLLSQARLAMIFHFEKQYYVDLSRLRFADVAELPDDGEASSAPSFAGMPGGPGAAAGVGVGMGGPRYRVMMPPIEGSLRLTEIEPYDIQAGRVLGLVDVIQMDARTQKELMNDAQEQAASLFQKSESRYIDAAQRSIAAHLEALLSLFGVQAIVEWPERHGAAPHPPHTQATFEATQLAGSR